MKHPLPARFVTHPIEIIVAGAGGNGSQFLNGLARFHLSLKAFNHPGLIVRVYDPDVVTEANVGRQLFSPSDIGSFKSDILVNRINCYYNLDWKSEPVAFTHGSGRCDILVGCVDSARARRELSHTRFDYWLDLGNSGKTGQVILGEPFEYDHRARSLKKRQQKRLKETGTERGAENDYDPRDRLPNIIELYPELNSHDFREDDAPSCSLAEALDRQDLFINQTVATFGLQLLWQFIRQGGLDIQGYFINLESGRVVPIPIDPLRHSFGIDVRQRRKSKKKKARALNRKSKIKNRR